MRKATPYQIALSILKQLKKAGFQAYFAGGCVRDRLLGSRPEDYDIATNAHPEMVIKLFPKTLTTGKTFGVINVIQQGISVEVTTFRTEGAYSDGRHPDYVNFSTLEADVLRRDFTINGMFYEPVKRQLIDLVGGKQDLTRRTIRAIGNPIERFKEDKLRMMRAIRLAVELNFKIEPSTWQALKKLGGEILQVSVERIREELKKILLSPRRAQGITLLDESGLLPHLLPEVTQLKGVKQPEQFHPEGDVYIHTLETLRHLRNPSWELALATLLHDIGKPATFKITDRIRFHEHEKVGRELAEKICDRFRLSNFEKEKVCWLVYRHMVFKDIEKMRVATLKRLFREPYYHELAELHRADRLASDRNLASHHYAQQKYREFSKEALKPKPLINGYDLIKLGLVPGPIFGEILRKVEEAQLEGEITTKQEAFQIARQIFSNSKKSCRDSLT